MDWELGDALSAEEHHHDLRTRFRDLYVMDAHLHALGLEKGTGMQSVQCVPAASRRNEWKIPSIFQ